MQKQERKILKVYIYMMIYLVMNMLTFNLTHIVGLEKRQSLEPKRFVLDIKYVVLHNIKKARRLCPPC